MFYKKILKPILFRFDPELVHNLMTSFGSLIGNNIIARNLVRFFYGYNGPDISKEVDGIYYKTPYLLSAGFDYNGVLYNILPSISLGGEEIGSVTALPCQGNPKPRLTRLPNTKSILVNKGLRNDGVEKIIENLKKAPKTQFVKGISIAKTNNSRSSTTEGAIADYISSFARLNEENIGDYYTLNISCPNAYGGETFTTPDLLDRLLREIKSIPCKKPIYVKMPINLTWDKFDGLLKVLDRYSINGVIIGNLNKDYNYIDTKDYKPKNYCGGLSGEPCRELSTELIKLTKKNYGSRFTIFGVGGVMNEKNAIEKFEAGADLIMLITGIIYEGPGLIKRLCFAYENYINKTKGSKF